MAALEIPDLEHDPLAKHVVQVIAGHANSQGVALLSFNRVAADMSRDYKAVRRATAGAVSAGYISVETRRGKTPVWRLNLGNLASNLGITSVSPGADLSRLVAKSAEEGEGEGSENPRFSQRGLLNRGDPQGVENGNGGEIATQQKTGEERLAGVVSRLINICTGTNHRRVATEAAALVAWAHTAMDSRLIDELVGAAAEWPKPPTLPRALESPLRAKAKDLGVNLPKFKP